MKKKLFLTHCILYTILFFSCAGQNNLFIPEPDFSVYINDKTIQIDNIIETKDGVSADSMPLWLLTFVNGGNRAVEQMEAYSNKYVFVGVNEGENFIALNKWAENYSAMRDFAILAAGRMEERMILTASLFPDDEYGAFFETLIKLAYSTEYVSAAKEDTYWFKKGSVPETYNFFVLITIERNSMQAIVRSMMAQANAAAAPTGSQAASVNRLRLTFFDGF